MQNAFSPKPLPEVSAEKLKKRETLLKAVVYVAASFILVNIGYIISLLVSHKGDSLSDLVGRNIFSMGAFGASLLLSSYALKKIKDQISAREHSGTNK